MEEEGQRDGVEGQVELRQGCLRACKVREATEKGVESKGKKKKV